MYVEATDQYKLNADLKGMDRNVALLFELKTFFVNMSVYRFPSQLDIVASDWDRHLHEKHIVHVCV